MSFYELNAEQLEQLAQNYLCETCENVSYGELAAASELVSFEQLENEYAGITFSPDDFC